MGEGLCLRPKPSGPLRVVQIHVNHILNCFLRLRPVHVEALFPPVHSIRGPLVWVLTAMGHKRAQMIEAAGNITSGAEVSLLFRAGRRPFIFPSFLRGADEWRHVAFRKKILRVRFATSDLECWD